MAKHSRTGGKHHRYHGSHHSESGGYNTKGAPEMSTPNKIDPGKHHQAAYRSGEGKGRGTGHTPKGPLGGIRHVKARTGY
jgi:hypothetical protein